MSERRTVGVQVEEVPELTCLRCGATVTATVRGAGPPPNPPFERLVCNHWASPEGWIEFHIPGTSDLMLCCEECAPVVTAAIASKVRELQRSISSVVPAEPEE